MFAVVYDMMPLPQTSCIDINLLSPIVSENRQGKNATSLDGALRMLAQAERVGILHTLYYLRRFLPCTGALRSIQRLTKGMSRLRENLASLVYTDSKISLQLF